jgi:hypothetical protein
MMQYQNLLIDLTHCFTTVTETTDEHWRRFYRIISEITKGAACEAPVIPLGFLSFMEANFTRELFMTLEGHEKELVSLGK